MTKSLLAADNLVKLMDYYFSQSHLTLPSSIVGISDLANAEATCCNHGLSPLPILGFFPDLLTNQVGKLSWPNPIPHASQYNCYGCGISENSTEYT